MMVILRKVIIFTVRRMNSLILTKFSSGKFYEKLSNRFDFFMITILNGRFTLERKYFSELKNLFICDT